MPLESSTSITRTLNFSKNTLQSLTELFLATIAEQLLETKKSLRQQSSELVSWHFFHMFLMCVWMLLPQQRLLLPPKLLSRLLSSTRQALPSRNRNEPVWSYGFHSFGWSFKLNKSHFLVKVEIFFLTRHGLPAMIRVSFYFLSIHVWIRFNMLGTP